MENEVSFTFNRYQIEQTFDRQLTDEEWKGVAEDLLDALDYYFWEEVPRVVNEIDGESDD